MLGYLNDMFGNTSISEYDFDDEKEIVMPASPATLQLKVYMC